MQLNGFMFLPQPSWGPAAPTTQLLHPSAPSPRVFPRELHFCCSHGSGGRRRMKQRGRRGTSALHRAPSHRPGSSSPPETPVSVLPGTAARGGLLCWTLARTQSHQCFSKALTVESLVFFNIKYTYLKNEEKLCHKFMITCKVRG